MGRLDSDNSAAFETEVMLRLDRGPSAVVFDFAGLTYVSSAGLRVVLLTAKRLRSRGGQFVLCGLTEPVRDVFKISGFLSVLTVEPDRNAALGRLNRM
jgi:stage II sporulation protein AA (anti-sigma F factor antagonist)